ncbi:hypothetical protein BDM02DRAFT_3087526 [Thelephora ganbajun]|uniref:Uncharacterized protein n=1 Tax=Thelephora ganbajun TaxID=370292 RepID=A0ACB6ZU80_THEGA|nr:hypothetical protein BDM02DRAFT_3087526 [Thelephora ganbajun]
MEENEAIHLSIPPRLYQVPGAALVVGTVIGAARGSRKEGLRFLAENAHRAPTTVKGWYFYNKTKNYRKMLGGLVEGGREGLKLSVTAMGWVTIEESIRRFGHGFEEVAEVGAGVGTGALFGLVYRLGLRTTGQSILLGFLVGFGMAGLRKGRESLALKVEQ